MEGPSGTPRRDSRPVRGKPPNRRGAPIAVQSMGASLPGDVEGNVRQAKELYAAGCDVRRVASATGGVAGFRPSKRAGRSRWWRTSISITAWRWNPPPPGWIKSGSTGQHRGPERVKAVADACRSRGIPIRVGGQRGFPGKRRSWQNMAIPPRRPCGTAPPLSRFASGTSGFFRYRALTPNLPMCRPWRPLTALTAAACAYPLHLGVTEAGTERMGLLKSAAGIGSLLLDGIGDTIRVSLTADPVREVEAGLDLLRALGLRTGEAMLVSCPHLWPDQNRFDPHRRRGGGAPARRP